MRSWYTYYDAYQQENLKGDISFDLAQEVQTLLAKNNPLFSTAAILTFLPLWRHVLPDLKMTSVKSVELVC